MVIAPIAPSSPAYFSPNRHYRRPTPKENLHRAVAAGLVRYVDGKWQATGKPVFITGIGWIE